MPLVFWGSVTNNVPMLHLLVLAVTKYVSCFEFKKAVWVLAPHPECQIVKMRVLYYYKPIRGQNFFYGFYELVKIYGCKLKV